MTPFFKKTAKFKVAEAKTEEQQPQEPQQPKEETVTLEPKPYENKEALWAELERLRGEWHKALEQGAALGYPRMIRLTQDGQTQYFYTLQALGQQSDQETSTFKFRALRSDMKIYDVEQKVRLMSFGPIIVSTEFKEVSPEESGLNPSELLQLVQTILKGETPL